jgi:hypothetical protein
VSRIPRIVSTPIPANAARQPNACPAAVPSGTPSTNARLPPPTVSATARPMSAGGTRCAEYAPTTAQNRPCARPPSTRVAVTSSNVGARAVRRLLVAKTASTASSSACRGTRRVRAASGALETTTATANTDTSRPTRDSSTPRSPLISLRRPVGSISLVTLRNTHAASVRIPTQGKRNDGSTPGRGRRRPERSARSRSGRNMGEVFVMGPEGDVTAGGLPGPAGSARPVDSLDG